MTASLESTTLKVLVEPNTNICYKKMMNDNLIDKLDEIGMLYSVIVSLFSAETLVDVESCEVSLKGVEKLRDELLTSKNKDNPKIKKSLDDAERIIKRDLEEFKKEQQDKQS